MSNSPDCKQYIMQSLIHTLDAVVRWGQRQNKYIESIEKTQNKAIRILNFKGPNKGAENLYKQSNIDKVRNIIIANCLFV